MLRVQVTVENFWRRYVVANVHVLRNLRQSPESGPGPKDLQAMDNHRSVTASMKVSAAPATSGNGSSGPASATANARSSQPQSMPSQGASTTGTQAQPSPTAQMHIAPGVAANPTNITIPPPKDFILLCFRVRAYLKRRHDLGLNGITRDRELFEEFRKAYAANFRRAHRTFGLQSVQKIKFVKV
jgi:hypothetical protein